jgi:NAD(P)-dependent dehydrogenase (short-subunit alcohol dehydrogenase family)
MSTHNKVAIVTGAGTGIGKAVTLALLRDGYRAGGRRREPLERTAAQSEEAARALVVPSDASDAASVRRLHV